MADPCKNVIGVMVMGMSMGYDCGARVDGGVILCSACFSRIIRLLGDCGELGGVLRQADFSARTGVSDDYVPDNLG